MPFRIGRLGDGLIGPAEGDEEWDSKEDWLAVMLGQAVHPAGGQAAKDRRVSLGPQKEAYRKMMEAKDDSVTDDGMVMETYGIRGVRMIKGSYENIKITTPEDMLLGEAILKSRRQSQ